MLIIVLVSHPLKKVKGNPLIKVLISDHKKCNLAKYSFFKFADDLRERERQRGREGNKIIKQFELNKTFSKIIIQII